MIETVNIATIAHYIKASVQVLADQPMLGTYLNRVGQESVHVKLEAEVIAGDGTGRHIAGFLTEAPVLVPTATTLPDQISEALAAVEIADYDADAIVMHPTRWHHLRTGKATGSGEYLMGSFTNAAKPTLWGVPVIRSRSVPINRVLVGAFSQGAALLMRQAVGVEIGRDGNDFTSNLVTILAEVRAGLAIFDPAAFTSLTLA